VRSVAVVKGTAFGTTRIESAVASVAACTAVNWMTAEVIGNIERLEAETDGVVQSQLELVCVEHRRRLRAALHGIILTGRDRNLRRDRGVDRVLARARTENGLGACAVAWAAWSEWCATTTHNGHEQDEEEQSAGDEGRRQHDRSRRCQRRADRWLG
jgi:hypothetical protein